MLIQKNNVKKLVVSLVLPLLVGGLGALLGGGMKSFKTVVKPDWTPPAFLFPIVWTILYLLMGISSYLIIISPLPDKSKKRAIILYLAQLGVNALWSLFFFTLNWYLFAFIWLLALIFLVIVMGEEFRRISPKAAYLQIPYLLWISFAAVLNFSIYLLN